MISLRKSIFYGGLILSLLLMICNPLVADGEPGLGDELFLEGQFEEAIAAYEAELAVASDPAPIYNNLAAAYFQIENVAQAKRYFQLAAEAAPENGMPWINLAMLYEMEGDLAAAEESYLKATASTEAAVTVNAYLGLSGLLLDKGDSEGSITALESALARIAGESAPEYQEARTQIYIRLGYIYATLAENELAFEAFTEAVQTGSESPVPWVIFGAFLEEVGMATIEHAEADAGAELLMRALIMYQEGVTRDSEGLTKAQEAYDTLAAKLEEMRS